MSDTESRVQYIVDNSLKEILETFYHQMSNAKEERDRKDAAVKLYDVLSKMNMLPSPQAELPPIKFNVQHLSNVVTGLTHLARYAGLESRMPKEEIEDALHWLLSEESVQ